MPLPKALRRAVRRAPSSFTGPVQRKKCRVCNNLDPRGHVSSICLDEAAKEPKMVLSLVLDALSLAKTKEAARGGCRFCNILIVVLDAFFEKWRGARVRINVELKEKAPIKVGIDGERWKNEVIEIYAGSGRWLLQPQPTIRSCLTSCHFPTWLMLTAFVLTNPSITLSLADTRHSSPHSRRRGLRRHVQLHPALHPGLHSESQPHGVPLCVQVCRVCPKAPPRCRPCRLTHQTGRHPRQVFPVRCPLTLLGLSSAAQHHQGKLDQASRQHLIQGTSPLVSGCRDHHAPAWPTVHLDRQSLYYPGLAT